MWNMLLSDDHDVIRLGILAEYFEPQCLSINAQRRVIHFYVTNVAWEIQGLWKRIRYTYALHHSTALGFEGTVPYI